MFRLEVIILPGTINRKEGRKMATTIIKLAKPRPPIEIFDPLPDRCGHHQILTGSDVRTCHSGCMFVRCPKGHGWIKAKDRMRRLKEGSQ